MALTDTKIRTAKPGPKHILLADGNGLYLRIHPTGTKSFLLRSRAGGSERWHSLGVYPDLSLSDARQTCAELKRKLDANVSDTKVEFDQAFLEWDKFVRSNYKSAAKLLHRFKKHIVPALSGARLDEVTRARVSSILTVVAKTAPVQSNRLLGDCKQFFSYCVERGWLEASPVAVITRKTVGGKEKPRTRVLEAPEVVELVRELLTDRFAPATRLALALLLFTGQRSGEIRGIQRSWLKDLLVIPATKNGKPHKVYLAPPARRLLSIAFRELGSEPFAGMENQVLSRAVKRMGVTWTPHDLRRTMATRMSDLGVPPHIVEKCLNHSMTGVMAVYNHAEYLPERRAAWRLWARYLLQRVREAKKSPESC